MYQHHPQHLQLAERRCHANDRYYVEMSGLEQEIKAQSVPKLRGHKREIWEELSFPRSSVTLRNVLPKIPYASIRRCLSEMKRDGYITKDTRNEKRNITKESTRKWVRVV